MRILKIAVIDHGQVQKFKVGDVVDIRSMGDGMVNGGVDEDSMRSLPKGVFRVKITEIDNPDMYFGNIVKYVGETDGGMVVQFDGSVMAKPVNSPNSAGIGESGRRTASEASEHDRPYIVDVICAWCQEKIGEQRSMTQWPSHGICKKCMETEMEASGL